MVIPDPRVGCVPRAESDPRDIGIHERRSGAEATGTNFSTAYGYFRFIERNNKTTRVNHATIVGFSCSVITGESTCMISLRNWFSRNIVSRNLAFDRADGFGSSLWFAISSRSKHESNFTFFKPLMTPSKIAVPSFNFSTFKYASLSWSSSSQLCTNCL